MRAKPSRLLMSTGLFAQCFIDKTRKLGSKRVLINYTAGMLYHMALVRNIL